MPPAARTRSSCSADTARPTNWGSEVRVVSIASWHDPVRIRRSRSLMGGARIVSVRFVFRRRHYHVWFAHANPSDRSHETRMRAA